MVANGSQDWREICHQILAEKDSQKLYELVEALNRALAQGDTELHPIADISETHAA